MFGIWPPGPGRGLVEEPDSGERFSSKKIEENKKGVGTREKGLMVEAVPLSRKF